MYQVMLECSHTAVILVNGAPAQDAVFGIQCSRPECPDSRLAFYNARLLRPVGLAGGAIHAEPE